MLSKQITYKTLDGNSVTREFYFHLSKIDLAEMDILTPDGYAKKLKEITETSEAHLVYPILKEIILASVGKRSSNGEEFERTDAIRNAFVQSNAYEVFIFDLLGNATSAADFMNGIIPKDLRDAVANGSGVLERSESPAAKPKTLDDYSMTELTNMPYEEFDRLLKSAPSGSLSKEHLQLAFQRRP